MIASKDEAIALSSEATYDKYVQYLTGSSERFKNSRINVVQFTLEAGDAPGE
ncbi:MAG: class I SAM-dependent methyltransferase [Rhodococcus sp.]|nr:class I SAM-dependent methyltransferase [Rhodococcus sp. (in: high G+C Gram-positive bacteria)]MCX6493447.1 class I SAM-dependent methyltransferase [Rhodococcus sp. (in: high G+C Gram-positive bacteria)]